ncbi:ATP-binding cassette domain-containing protein [Magnetococcales bacterium HHB-1]
MKLFLIRMLTRPMLASQLLLASFLVNMLALSSSIYVIQVLNRYVANGINSTLFTLTSGVLLAIVMEFAFRRVRVRLAQGINAPFNNQLILELLNKLTGAKLQALEQIPIGERNEVNGHIQAVQQAYNPVNLLIMLDLPFALLFVVALFMLHHTLGIVVALFLLAAFLISLGQHAAMRRPAEKLTRSTTQNGRLLGNMLRSADTVRMFNGYAHLRTLWLHHQKERHLLKHNLGSRQESLQAITQSIGALMGVTVIALGAQFALAGEMDVGAMIGANILAGRALAPVVKFARLGSIFAKAQQALFILSKLIALPMETTRGTGLKNFSGKVSLKDIHFTYPGLSGPLFESLTLDLTPGQVVGITGSNGCGKTTLIRVIAGLLTPERGNILVDHVVLDQITPEWWRKQLIYVPQQIDLLDGTIEDNLIMLQPDMGEKALNYAIEQAGLRSYLNNSTQGLEQPIINNGANLSLGIKKKIGLARALCSRGQVVLMDEPTEGLDRDGAIAVYQIINTLIKKGCTVIIATFDINIIRATHQIIDLDQKPQPKIMLTEDLLKKSP